LHRDDRGTLERPNIDNAGPETTSPNRGSEVIARRTDYVLCASLLVIFLHAKHHLSFRACSIILIALGLLLSALPGDILGGAKLPRTLTTAFARFDIADRFKVHPICYICHKIFEPGIPSDTKCPNCDSDIFRPKTRKLFRRIFESPLGDPVAADQEDEDFIPAPAEGEPHVVAPLQLLSEGLKQLFARPGIVPAVEEWKAREQVPEELKSMQDAEVWKTIKGPDNKSFFFGGECEQEIRLGVTFSLDW
jgi:hypothetical protein